MILFMVITYGIPLTLILAKIGYDEFKVGDKTSLILSLFMLTAIFTLFTGI